jgi:DNA-binding transcriptional ArsR family regulator
MTVSQLCAAAKMSQPNASNQLRVLHEFGFVAYRRRKMSVIYRADANDLVTFSPELLRALRVCYELSEPLPFVIRRVTAFTHQRRIEIARVLSDAPMTLVDLLERTGMSAPALSRHLRKLSRRGVVRTKGRLYSLARRPSHPLDKALLKLAVG